MCGVLGIIIKDFNEKDHDLIRGLFIQSMIRGKHATGVSYIKNNKVNTIKESIPSDKFIDKQNLNTWKNEDGNLYCIGHIRYSTSDLRYNQPFATDKIGIVHNGVISQEPSNTWFETFGYKTETENDSELILHMIEDNKNPLQYHNTSMAVCALFKDKRLLAFRNHERPLYYYQDTKTVIFASTKDILKRTGFKTATKTEMYKIYNVNNFELTITRSEPKVNIEDLQ